MDEDTNLKPKNWSLEQDFEYSPPKPEGDPWKILLHPLLKKDKIQCDAWKEEVQNLLIFAGLFSAVVTAFLIESYKALQPDPNAIIIDLLSQMNVQLAKSLNGTSGGPPGINNNLSSFSPTSSAIRINIFWFISLVLSLTTVLVGIISLQWLREYQSYPNFSPKENIALFHMRSDGFDKWYVEAIFTSLPLLLQAALVLFFGGMMDFLLRLGNEVAIPVIVVIGLTLFFLVATTILPTLQGFYLHLPFLSSRHLSRQPSQCPYKSPQSQAFRAVCDFGFQSSEYVFPVLQYLSGAIHRIFQLAVSLGRAKDDSEIWRFEDHHILPLLSVTWRKKAWIDFDLSWLAVRDACIYGRFHQVPGSHRGLINHTPLFDVSHALRDAIRSDNAKQTPSFLAAAYYCFQDLSTSFLAKEEYRKTRLYFQNHYFDVVIECNRYFSALFDGIDSDLGQSPMSNPYLFIDFASIDNFDVFLHTLDALHHQNLYMFLTYILNHHSPPMILRHRLEIQMRLMKALYGDHHVLHPSAMERNMPEYLALYPSGIRPLVNGNDRANFIRQYSKVIMDFFQYASCQNKLDVDPGCLHAHPDILLFLFTASEITYEAMHLEGILGINSRMTKQQLFDITASFEDIFCLLTERLKILLSNPLMESTPPGLEIDPDLAPFRPSPSYIFYTSAIYVQHLMEYGVLQEKPDPFLDDLLATMREYKIRMNPVGSIHRRLQEQFKGQDWWDIEVQDRFSDQWWSFLYPTPGFRMTALTSTQTKTEHIQSYDSVRRKYLGTSINFDNIPTVLKLPADTVVSLSDQDRRVYSTKPTPDFMPRASSSSSS